MYSKDQQALVLLPKVLPGFSELPPPAPHLSLGFCYG